jgi:hypothetical protein
VVDKGKMLPIGQDQGSFGLNNDFIKEEVEVREQSAFNPESVLLPSSFFLTF